MVAPTCQAQAWMLLAGHLAHKMRVRMKTRKSKEQDQQAAQDSRSLRRHHLQLPLLRGIGSRSLVLCYMLSRVSRVRLFATPGTVAHQAPLSMGFSRQQHWSGLPFTAGAVQAHSSSWPPHHCCLLPDASRALALSTSLQVLVPSQGPTATTLFH